MPNRGNLRKNSQGIWHAYNGSTWVPMNQYYSPDFRGAYAESQRQAISDIQAALYAMQVDRVYGDNPQNYSFHIGEIDPEEVDYESWEPAEEINLDALMNRAANQFAGGTIRKADFTGQLEDYYDILGWEESDFKTITKESYVVEEDTPGAFISRDEDGNQIRSFELGIDDPKDRKYWQWALTRDVESLNYQAHGVFINEVKAYLGMTPDTMVSHQLPDGRTVTSFEGQQYITEADVTGEWKATTLKDEQNRPVFTLVTDPEGKGTVHQLGSERADQYTMLVQEAGGTVTADAERAVGAPPTGVSPEAVIEDIVPGYDAVQTSAGRYELVKNAFADDAPIGKEISLGDGRSAVKLGPDDYEIITPSPVGEGNTYTDKFGQVYMRQPDGSVSQITPPTIDEQINQSLVSGDPDRALALSDFRDRPDAQERFQAALDFARQPGDLMAISAIVRGLVNPPPPAAGQIQRIADPPPWVVSAWQQLQSAWGVPPSLQGPAPGVGANQARIEDILTKGPGGTFSFDQDALNELKASSDIQDWEQITKTAEGMVGQLNQQRDDLLADLDEAQMSGDPDWVREIENELAMVEAQSPMGDGRDGDFIEYMRPLDELGNVPTSEGFGAAVVPDKSPDKLPDKPIDKPIDKPPDQPTNIGLINLETAYERLVVPDVGTYYVLLGDWRDFNRIFQEDGLDAAKDFLTDIQSKLTEAAMTKLKDDAKDGKYATQAAITAAAKAVAGDIAGRDARLEEDRQTAIGKAINNAWNVVSKDPDIFSRFDPTKGNTLAQKEYILGQYGITFKWSDDSKIEDIQAIGQAALQDYENQQARFKELTPGGQYQDLVRRGGEGAHKQKMDEILDEVEKTWMKDLSKEDPGLTELQEDVPIGQAISPQVPEPIGTGIDQTDPDFLKAASDWQRIFDERQPYQDQDVHGVGDMPTFQTEYEPSPWAGTQKEIEEAGVWGVEEQRAMAEIGESTGMEPWEQSEYASGFSKAPDSFEVSAPEEVWYGDDLEEDYMSYPSYAGGGAAFKDTLALVGEEGPELVELPAGSEVVPADFTEAMLRGRRPRRMAKGGLVEGASLNYGLGPKTGTLYGQEYPQDIPAGVRQLMGGRPIEQPRSLFRPAGLTVPSAQAMRNLIPEETEAYRELGRLTGIPEKAYEREFREAVPGGVSRVEQPRFMPRRMRRL